MRFIHYLVCIQVLLCSALVSSALAQSKDSTPARKIDTALLEKVRASMSMVDSTLTARANQLITNAEQLLGVPYRRGGSNEASGFDCSGFVRAMYEKTVGLVLPHSAREQAAVTDKIDPLDLQPGDLVFFDTMKHAFSHVGIYLGDGKFIHSPRSGKKVRIEDMREAYWARRFDGARRVPLENINTQYFLNSIKAEVPSNPADDALIK